VKKNQKNNWIILLLFFLITSANSENISDFNGVKCGELISSIDPQFKLKNKDITLALYSSLKLIVPSLGDLKKASEMSKIQRLEMEEYKKELIKLGATEEILNQTRVERFELNGQSVDIFVYPDGDVHHVSNYFKDKETVKNPILKVKNCKIEN